ncbi:MAG TPA: hypothetical protein PLR50_02705, partial [Candidatus Rifleibacterium sp.]|nr:hypothetical protein [Candidatus Rifleibacterium sp.]
MASLRQLYYQEYVKFKQSDAFKSLSAEERAQINKTAKETYAQLSENEAPMPEGQELRDQRGVLSNVITDLTSGIVNLGRAGVSGAAWAADVAGFPDAAKALDEKSQQMGETVQMISPPADPNRLVDFGSQALLQNIPTFAAGGALARALTGSAAGGAILNNARNAAGIPAMAGAAPLSESAASFLSTTALYGIPAARQANVEADGEIRAGNPYFELAAAIPYALIENTLGITPLKTMRAFSGGAAPAGIAKTIAANAGKIGSLLEKPLFELSGKAGIKGAVGAFSRFVAVNILGEATEEVFQAIEETAIPHFAKKPMNQAIKDTMTDLGKPEVVDLLTQAKGGAIRLHRMPPRV